MTNDDAKAVILLAEAYCAVALRLTLRFKKALSMSEPLLHAYRAGLIAQTGKVNGVTFSFHGGGVFLSCGGEQVDVQLGEHDFAGAFDAWRLLQFARTRDDFRATPDTKTLAAYLEEIARNGLLERYPYLGTTFYTLTRTAATRGGERASHEE